MIAQSEIASIDTNTFLNQVAFINVGVGWWRGQRMIKNATVEWKHSELNDGIITKPRLKLLPEHWKKRFFDINNDIQKLLSRRTVPCVIRSVSVVPKHDLADLFAAINHVEQSKFRPAVSEFIRRWDDLIEELHGTLTPSQFQDIERYLPSTPRQLERCFYIRKFVLPVQVTTDNDFLNASCGAIANELSAEISSAVDNLVARVNDKGIARKSTIGVVLRAFEKLEAFDFATSPETKEKIRQVKNDLTMLSARDSMEEGETLSPLAQEILSTVGSIKDQAEKEIKALSRPVGFVNRKITL